MSCQPNKNASLTILLHQYDERFCTFVHTVPFQAVVDSGVACLTVPDEQYNVGLAHAFIGGHDTRSVMCRRTPFYK